MLRIERVRGITNGVAPKQLKPAYGEGMSELYQVRWKWTAEWLLQMILTPMALIMLGRKLGYCLMGYCVTCYLEVDWGVRTFHHLHI